MKIKIDPKSPKKKFQEENIPRRPSKLGGKCEIFSKRKWGNLNLFKNDLIFDEILAPTNIQNDFVMKISPKSPFFDNFWSNLTLPLTQLASCI